MSPRQLVTVFILYFLVIWTCGDPNFSLLRFKDLQHKVIPLVKMSGLTQHILFLTHNCIDTHLMTTQSCLPAPKQGESPMNQQLPMKTEI